MFLLFCFYYERALSCLDFNLSSIYFSFFFNYILLIALKNVMQQKSLREVLCKNHFLNFSPLHLSNLMNDFLKQELHTSPRNCTHTLTNMCLIKSNLLEFTKDLIYVFPPPKQLKCVHLFKKNLVKYIYKWGKQSHVFFVIPWKKDSKHSNK